MKTLPHGPRAFLFLPVIAALTFWLLPSSRLSAAPQSQIIQPVNEANLVVLKGNTHPLARRESDVGEAPPELPMQRMLLVLKRSPEQEAFLQALLDQQQDKSSPNYHKWLTPDQFGQQFGPGDQDIQTLTSWLDSHGFLVSRVGKGRTAIEFSGTAAQVQEAFHTEIHRYEVNGEQHWANASDPQIPEALTPIIAGVNSLHNFPKTPMHRVVGPFSRSKATGEVRPINPMFTFPDPTSCGQDCYALGPYDFAQIYNVTSLWNAQSAIDGTGQSIAIVGRSNINIQDVRDFRNLFGLPPKDPQIILDGADPGLVSGDETESDLDVEWSGAVAKGATIKFVTSASTEIQDGVDLSALYIVAPIMSESYGACELFLGTAGNQFYSNLWEQAAAEGITVVVSAGDSGSAGCDVYNGTSEEAIHGLAVNGLASTPFNVSVGGTDFLNFGPNFNTKAASPYWNLNNDLNQSSAKGYIPEMPWNDSCTNPAFLILGFDASSEAACNDARLDASFVVIGGGGGSSNCITGDGANVPSCVGGYAKPPWQTGSGVPDDNARDLPDVSLFASNGFFGSFYVVCEEDQDPLSMSCNLNSPYFDFIGIGGTSSSAPTFAGVMALVNEFNNPSGPSGLGNANYTLYKLPAVPSQSGLNCESDASPDSRCIFNDLTSGTIAMPCTESSPNCVLHNPATDSIGVLSGYAAGPGYDLAGGLGTLNAYNLVHDWSLATFTPTTTTLSLNNGDPVNITHGQAVAVSIAVTNGNGIPTGDVSLIAKFSNGSSDRIGRFTLINGGASASTNLLPGGSDYTVEAHYEGDATSGGSDSSPVTVSVAAENSEVQLGLVTFDQNGKITSTNATTVPYGSGYVLQADVTNAEGAPCVINPPENSPCPTGVVMLTDNKEALDGGTYNLNSLGSLEDKAIQLTGGMHSLQASYGGDNSFKPSASSSSITVTTAPTTTRLLASGNELIGESIEIPAYVSSNSNGSALTGTVTFMNGNNPLGNPISVSGLTPSGNLVQATAVLTTQLSIGLNTVTAQYSGDVNYSSSPAAPAVFDVQIPTSVTITSSNSIVAQGTSVMFTANVIPSQGGGPAISGQISFFADALGAISAVGNSVPVVNGQAVFVTNVEPNLLPTGTVTLTAQYDGDTNYRFSSPSPLTETVNPQPGTDFSLTTPGPNPSSVTIAAPGASSTPVVVTVTPLNGFTGTVVFPYPQSACSISPPGSQSTCNISGTLPFGYVAPGQTIWFSIATTAGSSAVKIPDGPLGRFNWWTASSGTLLILILLAALPLKRRSLSAVLALMIFASLVGALVGCGGGTGSGGGANGGSPGTPTGVTYTATVTGTCGPLSHSASFTFVVQ